ncbi:MAG: hypothetical protein AAGA23_20840 [Pseudomonadota bacterium]
MSLTQLLAIVLAGGLASAAMTAGAHRYAQAVGLIDEPDPRRLHSGSIARGGGIGPLSIYLLGSGILGVLLDAPLPWQGGLFLLLLVALGFWDDHQPQPARLRFAAQMLAAVLLCWLLPLSVAGWIMVLVGLVWWINLFNFMDGSNGLAATEAIFISAVLTAVSADPYRAYAALALGASLGFLPWNFPRPRIFLGDAGSYGLAAVLALLGCLLVAAGQASWGLLLVLPAPFVVDASITLVRRMVTGQRWYTAHRQHLYQRLIAGGASPAQVVLWLGAVNVLFIVPALGLLQSWPHREAAIVMITYALLGAAWLITDRGLKARSGS